MALVREQAAERKSHALGYASCAMAGCLWGTGFYFGKIALTEMGVGHMVLYRFLFACVGLAPFALRHPPRFNRREWRILLIGSFLGVPLQFLMQFHGLALTTVSHASLMVGTMPVVLALGATMFAGERLDAIGWMALAASTAGVALVVLGGRHAVEMRGPSVQGDLWVIASMGVATAWVLTNKSLMEKHPPVIVTTYGLMSGAAMLAAWVLARDGMPPVHRISLNVWLALAASGLLCTTATTLLWNWGIHCVPASRAGVFLNIEPLLGSALGVALLGDHLGPHAWMGGALVLGAAIALTTRPDSHAPEIILE